MTSRLKRRLDNIGVDVSNSKLTESFCLIGTPLPPLEKSKDQNEFVPVWKQDVRDEKGRRRLHGAFTGGFSAGYFNTVGSKEGWAPTAFKSSRAARATTSKAARPEDFMDEEDLEELRNSKIIVDQTDEMDLLSGTQGELSRRGAPLPDDDPLANTIADVLLPTSSESGGAMLLRKMGWRPGQGVGPRVTCDQLRKQDMQSSELPVSARTNEMDEDDEARKHTFAPRDTKVIVFRPKENHFGLGYAPGATLSESANHGETTAPKISSGFGLGALNDAEEDDIDIYDSSISRRSGREIAYDGDEPTRTQTLRSEPRPSKMQDFQERERRPSIHNFHDGHPVLPGFVLSDKPVAEDTWFKIPDIPKGWKPDPRRVWSSSLATTEQPTSSLAPGRPEATRFKPSGKTLAEERGEMLGETSLPDQKPRSVFDYLSEKDRARLQNLTGKGSNDPSLSPSSPTPTKVVIPIVDPVTAQAALRGFQPFTIDKEKQSRYTTYLRSQIGSSSSEGVAVAPPERKSAQSVEDYTHELEEYAKSAMIFKPMSGAMANRFTSAAIVETGPKIQEGLHMPSSSSSLADAADPASKLPEKIQVEETPKQHAARLGMYGPLTREIRDWAPARLLCKRFGVKNPQPGPEASDAGHPDVTSSARESWEDTTAGSAAAQRALALDAPTARSGPKDISNIGLGEDDDQGRDTLTYQRPSMDIFKAIFASDAEDSTDDEEANAPTPPGIPSTTLAKSTPSNAPGVAPEALAPDSELGPIDLASFKPKFVPKSHRDREQKQRHADRAARESTSNKHMKRESKVKQSLVSFGDDDGGGESLNVVVASETKKSKKKKGEHKKRLREAEGEEEKEKEMKRQRSARTNGKSKYEEDEWVEKTPPPLPRKPTPEPADPQSLRLRDSHRPIRPKASDFL